MRYLALVTDYDGTLATDGRVEPETMSAIARVRSSGRHVILATGRTLESLQSVCDDLKHFNFVVLENGAVLYDPRTRQQTALAKRPPQTFVRRLEELGVAPIEVGMVIVATVVPHQTEALQAIQEMGLELHLIFNRTAVMVLPTGVNKATGMDHALRRLGLSAHEVVAIGDSANDHSFLEHSECAIAVGNAESAIKAMTAFTTEGEAGAGVREVIDELLENDLSRTLGGTQLPLLSLGARPDGTSVTIPPYGVNVLIAGPSGSGKSTTATGMIEQLIAHHYQVCIVDPEGDYGAVEDVITLGNARHAIIVSEVLALLEDPRINLNVNLLGIPLADRPAFFSQLFPNLQAMRMRSGRPHWIVLDEAHHMMPPERRHLDQILTRNVQGVVFITVHPEHLAPGVLSLVDVAIAVHSAEHTLRQVADELRLNLAWPEGAFDSPGTAAAWFPRGTDPPFPIELARGRAERIRHHRKYAVGDMDKRSFYFTGADGQHNLKAQNLAMFCHIADGIDEPTWLFHLRRGDFSDWFRSGVKDTYLADQAQRIEQRSDLEPAATRKLMCNLIEGRYTLPE